MQFFGIDFSRGSRPKYPYKVGLALSGGGARGFAHAGAIEAMLQVGLRPNAICGVSAGSVVAAMHAAGIPPREMVDMFAELGFTDLCSFTVPREGFCTLDKFKDFLRRNIPYDRIEDLPLPTTICATDFDAGKKVAFRSGPLADVVAASCCIPIVFKPIEIDGRRYVDGGVMANLPAWALRDKCQFLVGVNVSPMSSDIHPDGIISIAMRSYELMSKNNATHDMEMCDMLIRTDEIAHHKAFDLKGITDVFNNGYDSTMRYFESRGITVPQPCEQTHRQP